jgi:hypothetical protein
VLDGKPMAPPYMREWTYQDMADALDTEAAAQK